MESIYGVCGAFHAGSRMCGNVKCGAHDSPTPTAWQDASTYYPVANAMLLSMVHTNSLARRDFPDSAIAPIQSDRLQRQERPPRRAGGTGCSRELKRGCGVEEISHEKSSSFSVICFLILWSSRLGQILKIGQGTYLRSISSSHGFSGLVR